MNESRSQTLSAVLFICWGILLLAEEGKNAAAVSTTPSDAALRSCTTTQKIAVIGGGITGAATAAFLKNLGSTACQTCEEEGGAAIVSGPACKPVVRIDVFEASKRLGGRLDFITVSGGYLEVGGEALNSSNKYMEKFIAMYNADRERLPNTSEVSEPAASVPGMLPWKLRKVIFNDRSIPLWSSCWIMALRLRAKYTVQRWTRLYKMFEEKGFQSRPSNTSVSQTALATVDPRMAFGSGLEILKAVGLDRMVFSKLSDLVNSLVLPPGRPLVECVTGAVYTQNLSVQALAGLLSIVCVFERPLLRTVPHRLVVEYLFRKFADNIYLDCSIEKILQHVNVTPGGTEAQAFTLQASKCESLAPDHLREQKYDYVVIATQLSSALRIFRQTENQETVELSVPYYDYQKVHVTIVEAEAIKKDARLVQNQTLVVATPEHPGGIGTFFVSSCGNQTQDEFVICKLKSGRELSDKELASLFQGIRLVERRQWQAYPNMHPFADTPTTDKKTYPSAATTFELMPGLFHPNAFEGLISCMEGQAVAARNIAHLIMNSIMSRSGEARRISTALHAEAR